MTFAFYPVRLQFLARDPIYFPPGKTSNILRGSLGAILKRVACPASCQSAATCQSRDACLYARIFEPSPAGPAPSGLADLPRPFVLRAAHLDGRRIAPGETFHFDLHLFDTRDPSIPAFVIAFATLAEEGIGPARGRAVLASASSLEDPLPFYSGGRFNRHPPVPTLLSLLPGDADVRRIQVLFVTPVELKQGQEIVSNPRFDALFARARDRIGALSRFYGSGPLEIDFRETGVRAALISTASHTLRRVEASRRSGSTGQSHSLGGSVGDAIYEGNLREFIPYLRVAKWTGVGRQTVWGKGHIEVVELPGRS
jgi:hypothetical protein